MTLFANKVSIELKRS